MTSLQSVCTLIGLLLIIVATTKCDDSKLYTEAERTLLPMLRDRVLQNLTQSLMKENKYLVRFLRAQHHDLDRTETMIRQHLEWRRENKIDSILAEDWSQWLKRIPIMDHITDHDGRPCIAGSLYDLRKAIIGGRSAEFKRYVIHGLERSIQKLHNASNQSGTDFTSTWFVVDLAGYNFKAHACQLCVPIWIELVMTYETHYPQLGKFILVNAPTVAPHFYDSLKPFLSKQTWSNVQVYNFDKGAWKQKLLEIFPGNVLPPQFGGVGPMRYVKTH